MIRIAAFIVLFAGLLAGYEAARGTELERFVVEEATVRAAAHLIRVLDPSLSVRAEGARLVAPGGGLVVLAGCEGIDVLLLLAAAMAVAPMPWRARLAGLAAGAVWVFALNQGRVIALFYAFRFDRDLYATLHGAVTPLLMALAAGAFFFAWHARYARPQAVRAR